MASSRSVLAQGLWTIMFLCYGVGTIVLGSDNYTRPGPGQFILTQHTESSSYPQQVHVSAVGEYMRISWITDDQSMPSKVEYGKVQGKYDTVAEGESSRYSFHKYRSGKIHNVKIGPLEPDTVYYYRCSRVGAEFSFKTTPASLPLDFVIVGDLGQTKWTKSTLAHIGKLDYDMLLMPGDLSYADKHQPLWDSYGRMMQPYASTRPWMVVEGNHEIEKSSSIASFIAYNNRWKMPHEESGSHSNLYYSFNVASSVHVIMLGSYADFASNSAQYKWLVSDLAKVDRSITPWLIVLLHAPWYNTNKAHQGEGESMRKAMEALLYKARVDVIFAGHVHAYERFKRIYNEEENRCGPVYITIGDGGNREGLANKFIAKHKYAKFSLFREASFGHGRLWVIDGKKAIWSWHRNDDSAATVRDEVQLESLSSSSACHVKTKLKDEM